MPLPACDDDVVEAPESLLDDLLLKLSMARGLDEVMDVIRARARGLVGADGITFVLRDGNRCHYADEDAISPLWKGQRFPMETCISGWAMIHRSPAVIPDIYADSRIPHAAYRPTFVRSLVMVPVRAEDPVGAIGAYWAHSHDPSPEAIRILQRIANGAAVAMTNVALINSLRRAREDEERLKDAIVFALAALAETRDNETGAHIHRTQHYVRALAEGARQRDLLAHGLDDETVELLFKSAPLHDIGKVGVPDRILFKPGPLDADEYAVMKTHPELGYRAVCIAETQLGACRFLDIAKELVRSHHERWDGTGYPDRLAGDAIPLAARLMAVADVYDALVSRRVYKAPIPHRDAVAIIAAERGRHFDPRLVDVFVAIEAEFEAIHDRFSDGLPLTALPSAPAAA